MLYLEPVPAEDFDVLHGAFGDGSLLCRLNAAAFGRSYPRRIEPFGRSTVRLLRLARRGLGLRPGGTLIDIGCGRGGPGLRLAGTMGLRLTGIDFSSVALLAAARRALSEPLAHPARFQHGLLDATGLPPDSADAVICFDALTYAPDRLAALREIRRVLRPGGRALITVPQALRPLRGYPRAISRWHPLVRAAGLTLLHRATARGAGTGWQRLYRLWNDHALGLRHALGRRVAGTLLDEASAITPLMSRHGEHALLLGKPHR
jgi:SAM-dependent methyltransferase